VLQEEKTLLRANEYVWKPARIGELRALLAEQRAADSRRATRASRPVR
jgi:hypothetical protein